jgi:hypothetical protein
MLCLWSLKILRILSVMRSLLAQCENERKNKKRENLLLKAYIRAFFVRRMPFQSREMQQGTKRLLCIARRYGFIARSPIGASMKIPFSSALKYVYL